MVKRWKTWYNKKDGKIAFYACIKREFLVNYTRLMWRVLPIRANNIKSKTLEGGPFNEREAFG